MTLSGSTLHALERLDDVKRALTTAQADAQAARELARAREEEIASLQNDLRAAYELLAGFQIKDPEVHIRTDFEGRQYFVERHFRRVYGVFTTVREAHMRRQRVRSMLRTQPHTSEFTIDQERAAIGAGS